MIKNRLSLIITILIILLNSCTDSRIPHLAFADAGTRIEPGLTAKAELLLYFTEDDRDTDSVDSLNLPVGVSLNPGKKDLKSFDSLPEITVSSPAFRILSIDHSCTDEGITASVTVIASEELLSGTEAELTAEWNGITARTVVAVRKDPKKYIDAEGVITDAGAYDELINKQRRLPPDYIPEDLVRVEVPTILTFDEVNHLRAPASAALSEMFAAAESEKGFTLLARSGYRSYKTQVSLYELNVREYGIEYARRISAQPGTSEHQSGLAMDISSPVVNYQLNQEFGDTEEGIWVAENAHRFGFIIRYPKNKEDITGYTYEPWHLRWVGQKLAGDIYSRGICLEEYFN